VRGYLYAELNSLPEQEQSLTTEQRLSLPLLCAGWKSSDLFVGGPTRSVSPSWVLRRTPGPGVDFDDHSLLGRFFVRGPWCVRSSGPFMFHLSRRPQSMARQSTTCPTPLPRFSVSPHSATLRLACDSVFRVSHSGILALQVGVPGWQNLEKLQTWRLRKELQRRYKDQPQPIRPSKLTAHC